MKAILGLLVLLAVSSALHLQFHDKSSWTGCCQFIDKYRELKKDQGKFLKWVGTLQEDRKTACPFLGVKSHSEAEHQYKGFLDESDQIYKNIGCAAVEDKQEAENSQ